MFMRHLGGGVGHQATNHFTEIFRRDNLKPAANNSDDTVLPDENASLDDDECLEAEEEDYGYGLVYDNDDGVSDDEATSNLGAEDGEEPWDMDDLEAEGYGEL